LRMTASCTSKWRNAATAATRIGVGNSADPA
jgi:hypothetical protein